MEREEGSRPPFFRPYVLFRARGGRGGRKAQILSRSRDTTLPASLTSASPFSTRRVG